MFRIRHFLALFFTCALIACGGFEYSDGSGNSEATNQDSFNDNSVAISTAVEDESTDDLDDADGCPDVNQTNPAITSLSFPDGPGGALWKPVSEGDGNLVILFPGDWQAPFRVQVQRTNGNLEACIFGECGNDDSLGPRQTCRVSLPGAAYTGLLVIEGASDSGEVQIECASSARCD